MLQERRQWKDSFVLSKEHKLANKRVKKQKDKNKSTTKLVSKSNIAVVKLVYKF